MQFWILQWRIFNALCSFKSGIQNDMIRVLYGVISQGKEVKSLEWNDRVLVCIHIGQNKEQPPYLNVKIVTRRIAENNKIWFLGGVNSYSLPNKRNIAFSKMISPPVSMLWSTVSSEGIETGNLCCGSWLSKELG